MTELYIKNEKGEEYIATVNITSTISSMPGKIVLTGFSRDFKKIYSTKPENLQSAMRPAGDRDLLSFSRFAKYLFDRKKAAIADIHENYCLYLVAHSSGENFSDLKCFFIRSDNAYVKGEKAIVNKEANRKVQHFMSTTRK